MTHPPDHAGISLLVRGTLGITLSLVSLSTIARADFVFYQIPGTTLVMLLEGRVTHNPGGTATLAHPRGNLFFNSRDLQVVESQSAKQLMGRQLRSISRSKDADEYLRVAKWALRHGMLDRCKDLLGDAWKLDPQHPHKRKLAGLMKYINRPAPRSSAGESHVRDLVGGASMTATRSKHFLLLHDGDTTKDPVTRKTRAEMRLELLETVYESYFLTFAFQGKYLRPPIEPLAVVFFSRHADFLQMERRLEIGLRQVAGFYLPSENVSIFYDSATTPRHQALERLNEGFQRIKVDAKRGRISGAGEIIRLGNTLELLTDIERESEDVATVSHECIHHLAANTGLIPRESVFVRWIHEGLASYFESAELATWSGAGVVDQNRIAYYRILEPDPVRGGLEFIVSDLGFLVEAVIGDQRPAYGQAWALTHFLFNKRFDQLMEFYKQVFELPKELEEEPEEKAQRLLAVFDEVFGDRATLELEWRRYMRTLKTDLEIYALGK